MIAIKFGSLSFASESGRYIPIAEYAGTAGFKVSDVEHKGEKPYVELGGPELRTRAFSVTLTRMLGVDPEALLEQIKTACEAGSPDNLYVNGVPESKLTWVMTGCNDSDYVFGARGSVQSLVVQLSFKEYGGAEPKKKKKAKKKKKK